MLNHIFPCLYKYPLLSTMVVKEDQTSSQSARGTFLHCASLYDYWYWNAFAIWLSFWSTSQSALFFLLPLGNLCKLGQLAVFSQFRTTDEQLDPKSDPWKTSLLTALHCEICPDIPNLTREALVSWQHVALDILKFMLPQTKNISPTLIYLCCPSHLTCPWIMAFKRCNTACLASAGRSGCSMSATAFHMASTACWEQKIGAVSSSHTSTSTEDAAPLISFLIFSLPTKHFHCFPLFPLILDFDTKF